jgi:probable F420-dependent oxidoreductase
MQFDVNLESPSVNSVGEIGRTAEEIGIDGAWITEKTHSPFTLLPLVAEATSDIDIGTAITVAFPRSPMVTAYSAWDLQQASNGRFVLGLGTQVKGHIKRRFAEAWTSPGPRLRDYVRAIRAIWESWRRDEEVDYHGDFYSIDLCPPDWRPDPIDQPDVPIYVAGVNSFNLKLAGHLCDGLHVHPLCSPEYIEKEVIPTVKEGCELSGRRIDDVTLVKNVYTISGETESEREQERETVKRAIAFHASTRTYRTILSVHDWEDLSEELHELSTSDKWDEMAGLITDEMVQTFAVQAPKEELFDRIQKRYPNLDRVAPYTPFRGGDEWSRMVP